MVDVTAQPPATVTAGSEFGLTVMVENPNGSLETSYVGNVTVALANNPGDDVLGGTITVAVQGGIATFSDLTLDRAASGATLIVNAGGTAIVTTTAITVFASGSRPARGDRWARQWRRGGRNIQPDRGG